MWKVGCTKTDRTWARYIVLVCVHRNLQKSDFFGKTLRTRKFSTGKFFGATESLRTQDSENVVGLGDRASISKLQPLKVRL